jgi:hypothetical protein
MANVNDDFFEPDEPVADVLAAFEAGEQRLTSLRLPGGGVIISATPTFVGSHPVTPPVGVLRVELPQRLTA